MTVINLADVPVAPLYLWIWISFWSPVFSLLQKEVESEITDELHFIFYVQYILCALSTANVQKYSTTVKNLSTYGVLHTTHWEWHGRIRCGRCSQVESGTFYFFLLRFCSVHLSVTHFFLRNWISCMKKRSEEEEYPWISYSTRFGLLWNTNKMLGTCYMPLIQQLRHKSSTPQHRLVR